MDLSTKIYPYLSSKTALTDIISNRIYPNVATNLSVSDQPYVVFTIISDVPEYSIDGNSGLSLKRLQISVWALKYIDVHSVDKIIEGLFDNWSSEDSDIGSVTKDNSVDRYEENTKLHGVISDYLVFC